VLLKIQIIGIYQPYKNNIFPNPLSPAPQFIQHKAAKAKSLVQHIQTTPFPPPTDAFDLF